MPIVREVPMDRNEAAKLAEMSALLGLDAPMGDSASDTFQSALELPFAESPEPLSQVDTAVFQQPRQPTQPKKRKRKVGHHDPFSLV